MGIVFLACCAVIANRYVVCIVCRNTDRLRKALEYIVCCEASDHGGVAYDSQLPLKTHQLVVCKAGGFVGEAKSATAAETGFDQDRYLLIYNAFVGN